MSRESSELKPLLFKLGVALTVSFSGYLFSRHRTRRVRASRLPPSSASYSSEVDSIGGRDGPKDDNHASSGASTSSNIGTVTTEKYQEMCIEKAAVDDAPAGQLPKFNELVKEVDYSATDRVISPKKGVEMPRADVGTPRTIRCAEPDEYEQEIKHLKSMVRILRERERNLEVQLLEYYGLKEQEKTVMELENRLRICSMEAKLLSLKIESLQADNRRLEAQVADHGKVMAELEAANGKIKLLKKKLRYEAEQNREHILTLQERVANLKEQEQKSSAHDFDVQSKLQKLKDLEGEAEDLRSSNLRLQQENAELGQRLESTQMIATSVLEDSKQTELKEANDNLKGENETLTKKIEELQANKCADVEELVYLRWLNACLRFEIRNHQPSPVKAVPKDLSKKASPKLEEKAKQLVVPEYTQSEGIGEKGSSIAECESDRWSTSQASEFELPDESTSDLLSSQKTRSSKNKFITKLKKLIKGKDGQHGQSQHVSSEKEDTESSYSWSGGTEAHSNRFTTPPRTILPLDIPRSRTHKAEDNKETESRHINIRPSSSSRDKRYELSRRASADLAQEMDSYLATDKSYLAKYSAPLKITSGGGTPRFCRKSASYSSF